MMWKNNNAKHHSKSVFIVDNEKANLNYEIFKYEALNIGEKQFDDDAAKLIKTS